MVHCVSSIRRYRDETDKVACRSQSQCEHCREYLPSPIKLVLIADRIHDAVSPHEPHGLLPRHSSKEAEWYVKCPSLPALADRSVLIQPNLRFFHELFGWEVELARREEDERQRLAAQMREQGLTGKDGDIESPAGRKKREILYSWPSFCRDLVRHFPP